MISFVYLILSIYINFHIFKDMEIIIYIDMENKLALGIMRTNCVGIISFIWIISKVTVFQGGDSPLDTVYPVGYDNEHEAQR